MKNFQSITAIAAFFAINLLISCTQNAENRAQLQEPVTSQAGDTTAQNAATAQNEKEEDGDEDEASEKKEKNAGTGNANVVVNNLSDAFTGETTASAKYAAYAKKAAAEGYPQIAMLFKAASTSENIHANNHKAALEDLGAAVPVVKPVFTVKATQENLQDALAGESYEIATMYPEFLANAKPSGNQLVLLSLKYAFETEKKHKVLYGKAIAALQSNQVKTLSMNYYVCPTCGNTYDTTPPKRCGISMTGSEKFIAIAGV